MSNTGIPVHFSQRTTTSNANNKSTSKDPEKSHSYLQSSHSRRPQTNTQLVVDSSTSSALGAPDNLIIQSSKNMRKHKYLVSQQNFQKTG